MANDPYILSFTVGGLFLFEGIELARLRVSGQAWEEVRRIAPAGIFVAAGGASSVKRIRNEVLGRLRRLNDAQVSHLASAGMTDARALMWVAACRKYRILADFAHEVLNERLRSYQPEVRFADFDQLLDTKGEVAMEIAPSTRARLRNVAFRMLREAELIDAQNRVRSLPLSETLLDLFDQDRQNGVDLIPGCR